MTDTHARRAVVVAGYEVAIKVAFPILLGISGWTFTQLLDHSNRLTAIEVRAESIVDDVREIKSDVKTLLAAK